MMAWASNVRALTCLLLVGLLAAPPGPAFGSQAAQTPQQPDGSKYDGEAIFRGLYFGQGPVADLFPELWKQQRFLERKKHLTADDERRMGEIREKIITGLRAKDKGFFDSYASTLRSGDHLAIGRKTAEVTDSILAILEKETGRNPTEPIIDSLAGVYRYVYFWQYLYLYFYVYVYEFITLVVYFSPLEGPIGGLATMKGITRLQREQWIDLIAKRLGKTKG